jgi:hypothetical protein
MQYLLLLLLLMLRQVSMILMSQVTAWMVSSIQQVLRLVSLLDSSLGSITQKSTLVGSPLVRCLISGLVVVAGASF